MTDELLITVNEAARRVGFGRSFLYGFIRRGELLSVKIGGARRILVSDLEDFVSRLREAAQ
jgi:excisionase family DNA binding protein